MKIYIALLAALVSFVPEKPTAPVKTETITETQKLDIIKAMQTVIRIQNDRIRMLELENEKLKKGCR